MKLFSRLFGRRKTMPRAQAFEAARAARRLATWRAGSGNINAAIRSGGEVLRARARDLVRNNPYASNAAASFSAHAVGCGIKPSSLVEDIELKDRIQRLWLAWSDEADADGVTDFYGLQALAARALFEAGECFFRLQSRRPSDGLTVPLQLQLIAAEQIPLSKCETLSNGNEIIFGIEFDRSGRRVAYHFLRTHPGDVRQRDQGQTVRVPAEQVIHVFSPQAEGQIRGVPMVAPAMAKLWLLEQYDDAELDRKKVAAMFAGFITKPAPEDIMGESQAARDEDEAALLGLQPGSMQLLLPGEDIKFSDPADVGGSYEAFQYRTLLACCSAMGVPYTNVTGDLRQANYSSLREGKLEFRRRIDQLQHNVLIFQLCRPVWKRWLETAVLAGALDIPDFSSNRAALLPAKWIPPKWDWVDPLKDRKAEIEAINAGLKSRSDVIEAEGHDAEEVDRRIAADRAREEKLGLSFETVSKPAQSDPADDERIDPAPGQNAA